MQKQKTREMMLAALFAALTAAISPVRIPLGITPVPLTLQTIMPLLGGALLGARLGALSQALYVLAGAIGLPVFSGGTAGPAVLLGPTAGYLFGFIAAAFVVGKIFEATKRNSLLHNLAAMAVGMAVIYAFGAAWALLTTGLPLEKILLGWVLPFAIGDAAKIVFAAIIAKRAGAKKHAASAPERK